MNIAEHALAAAQSPALITDGGTISYGELHDRSRRVAAALHELGLRRGDGVALVLPNRPEFLEISWGCQLSGLYYTPVNTHFTADEVVYVIDDSDAKAVFVDASLPGIATRVRNANPAVHIGVGGKLAGWRDYEEYSAPPAMPHRCRTDRRCCIRPAPPAGPRRSGGHFPRTATGPGRSRCWSWR